MKSAFVACNLLPIALLSLVFLLVSPEQALAQGSIGDKAVWDSMVAPSQVWIDASAYWTSGTQPDICQILYLNILNSSYSANYPNGAVIDARGLYYNGGSGNTTISCSHNPFYALTSPPPPTAILLPAVRIPIAETWTVPNNTKIVGEERQTILQAVSGMTGYMIEMGGPDYSGTSSLCPLTGYCTSVGIENLYLEAQFDTTAVVNGIENEWAQDSSYVNNVNMHMLMGIGLHVAAPLSGSYPGAVNSGPYTNLAIGSSSSGTPQCIDLETQTRGIHGVTCVGNSNTRAVGYAGIQVNASNNSIEDIHVESFWDGIEIGNISSTMPAVANVAVSNFTGSNFVKNVIHICGSNPVSTSNECPMTSGTVTDVAIIQATNIDLPGFLTLPSPVIEDDVTKTSIQDCSSCAFPLGSALYVLGRPVGGGYSRFATSPANTANYGSGSTTIPTWGVGGSSITSLATCLTPGALYSYPNSASGTIYVCTYGGWHTII